MSAETPNLDLPEPATVSKLLHQMLVEMPRPLFAAMDGALFGDLRGDLLRRDIARRSLFREEISSQFVHEGPWLVSLTDDDAVEYVAGLALAQPCAVFWSCAEGEEVLWHHLRTINEVQIPATELPNASETAEGYARVLFRHWDPNVLAGVMPVLSAAQFARVFGPAQGIVMNAPDYGGLSRTMRGPNLPLPVKGPLRIEPAQIERLQDAMVHSSRLRIARFLRENIPPGFEGINDDFVWGATLASEPSADELGIVTERGRARWAYVMLISDGKAARLQSVRDHITKGSDTPDEQVRTLIDDAAAALRTGQTVHEEPLS